MTKADKPVKRETYSRVRERGRTREIVVTIHSTWLELRLKGTRKSFQLDVEAAYHAAAKIEANRTRTEKLAAKKKKPAAVFSHSRY